MIRHSSLADAEYDGHHLRAPVDEQRLILTMPQGLVVTKGIVTLFFHQGHVTNRRTGAA